MLVRMAQAQHITVPRLLVEAALAADEGQGSLTHSERRNAIIELFALHRLLASISLNVNQIAKATNATGQVQAEMTATLQKARQVAERIDDAVDTLSLAKAPKLP